MNLLLLFWSLIVPFSHDVQIALFKIHQDQDKIHVQFVFEKEDIIQTLGCSDEEFNEEKLFTYLNNNFSIIINNSKKTLEYSSVELKNKHMHLKAKIPFQNELIQSLDIENSCLLNIKKHSNIIEVRLNEEERDFLMNKNRTSIQIKY